MSCISLLRHLSFLQCLPVKKHSTDKHSSSLLLSKSRACVFLLSIWTFHSTYCTEENNNSGGLFCLDHYSIRCEIYSLQLLLSAPWWSHKHDLLISLFSSKQCLYKSWESAKNYNTQLFMKCIYKECMSPAKLLMVYWQFKSQFHSSGCTLTQSDIVKSTRFRKYREKLQNRVI